MSAIAILFKMKINETKLRLFLLEHGQEHDEEEDATLTIHTGPWDNVIVLDIQKSGQMKSLGFVHGMGEESTQHEITKKYLEKVCACISRKFASQETKLAGLKLHVYNKAMYVGQFGSWSLAKFREWDVPISKCLKNITHNMQSHPNRLLYMLKESCGLGHKKLSDVIMAAKWALLHRSEQGDWETRQAASNLVTRMIRVAGVSLVGKQGVWINHDMAKKTVWWADSLLEWLGELGMGILKGGPGLLGSANQQLMAHPLRSLFSDEQMKQLVGLSIHVVGDLTVMNNEETDWIPGEYLGLPWLEEITQLLTIPTDSVGIRYGQCWYTDSESGMLPKGTLIEILGKNFEGKYYIREWKQVVDYGPGNLNRYITSFSLSRGAGSAMIVSWSDIFSEASSVERVVLSKDYITDKGKKWYIGQKSVCSDNKSRTLRK